MCAEEEMLTWDKLEPLLAQIKEAAIDGKTEKIYKLLSQLVSGYSLTTNGFDDIRV